MTREEFQKIISPIYLLNQSERIFIEKALKANFEKWQKSHDKSNPLDVEI